MELLDKLYRIYYLFEVYTGELVYIGYSCDVQKRKRVVEAMYKIKTTLCVQQIYKNSYEAELTRNLAIEKYHPKLNIQERLQNSKKFIFPQPKNKERVNKVFYIKNADRNKILYIGRTQNSVEWIWLEYINQQRIPADSVIDKTIKCSSLKEAIKIKNELIKKYKPEFNWEVKRNKNRKVKRNEIKTNIPS